MTMERGTKQQFRPVEMILDDIDFKKILQTFIGYKWHILTITLISFLIGVFYTLKMTPKYVSTALIQVDSQLGSANNMQQMLGNMNNVFSSNNQASPADIEIALIKSPFILQSVVDKLHLTIQTSPHYFPLIGSIISRHHHREDLAQPFLGFSQYAWGGEKIDIAQFDTDNQSIGVNFTLRSEGDGYYSLFLPDGRLVLKGKQGTLAKTKSGEFPAITLMVAKLKAHPGMLFNLVHKYNDDALRPLSQNLSIIDLGSKDKTKTGVLQIAFQDGNPQFIPQVLNTIVEYAIQKNVEKKSSEASKTLDFLNRQLPTVRQSLEKAETDLNEYRAKNGTIDLSQEAKIMLTKLSTIEQSIAEAKLKKMELLQELTPEHPLIIALTQKQAQLQKDVMRLENKIKRVPRTDQRAMSLERDVKVKDQLYLLLLNKIQQLQVLKAGTLSDIRVLSLANVPITPLPSHKLFTLFTSLLMGFLITLISIFIRELLRRGVSDPELVEETLNIPTLGIIPYSRRQKQLSRNGKLLAKSAPKDIAIEGIRSLRTILQFSLEQANNNIITILGATPSIGKSFISTNLAQVMADSGKKVLLVDCDLRKGSTHHYLHQKKSPGFAELLANQSQIAEVTYHVTDNLDFIPTGEYPSNPSEILMSQKAKQLFDVFSLAYDVILIDTPPILAVTDGLIIARHAAFNILVIGCGSDQIDELRLVVKRTKRNGLKIDGLVFNNRIQTKQSYGQCAYYYAYDNE